MRAVISVANVAWGVGRSTTAVSLAAELPLRGFETLLIDADPQTEATVRLIDPESVGLSVADLVFAPDPGQRADAGGPRFGLADVLAPTAIPPLYLAPSSIRLAAGEGNTPLSFYVLNNSERSSALATSPSSTRRPRSAPSRRPACSPRRTWRCRVGYSGRAGATLYGREPRKHAVRPRPGRVARCRL